MQWSARLVILALKLPATMLQSSPMASLTMLGSLAASVPAILEARRMAVSEEQWMVVMPQRTPAMPTMAIRPLCVFVGVAGCACGVSSGGMHGVRRVAAIISKTSSVAHSRTDFQAVSSGSRFSSAETSVAAVVALVMVTKRLRGAGRRVLLLARG